MKKKMVTMLLIGVMAVMTACGSGDKNSAAVSDDINLDDVDENVTIMTSTDGEGNTTTTIIRDDDQSAEDDGVVSVDDVKFNVSDLTSNEGSTYEIKQQCSFEKQYSSREHEMCMVYKMSKDNLTHISYEFQNYVNDELDKKGSKDFYYDLNNRIKYVCNKNENLITKSVDEELNDGYMRLSNQLKDIFDLPWKLKTETDNELIFSLSEEDDFKTLIENQNLYPKEKAPISNLTASYIYGKNGTKLQSIDLSFDIDATEIENDGSFQHFEFSLTESNVGNTTVEIPEDIINNAVEEEE